MTRKVPVSFYITEAQQEALTKIREQTRVPTSRFIRDAVDEAIAKWRELYEEEPCG